MSDTDPAGGPTWVRPTKNGTSAPPTREQIIDVLVMSPMSDFVGQDMSSVNRTADAVLELLNGGTIP